MWFFMKIWFYFKPFYNFGGLDDNTEVDTVDSEAERFRCFKETLLFLDGMITIDVPLDLKMTSGPPP